MVLICIYLARPETLPNGQKPWVKIAEHPPNSIIRSNGTPIELECTADGSPSPYIRWYRDYKPIIEVCTYYPALFYN